MLTSFEIPGKPWHALWAPLAAQPPKSPKILKFVEKPDGDNFWINGGFFVFETDVIDHIENDATILEKDTLPNLSIQNQVNAYKHNGFWQPMDTLRDKSYLEKLWISNNVPWKTW